MFSGLDPKQIAESGRPLQDILRENLVTALKELDGSAIGDPLEVAAMQNTLGDSLFGLGEYGMAIEVFSRARETRKAKLGLDHPDTLTSMSNLAVAYRAAGKNDLALPLFEETLKLRKAKLGLDHPQTLTSMNNLALAYKAAGKFDLALPIVRELVTISRKVYPKDSPQLAQSFAIAGTILLPLKSFPEAEPILRECLAIREKAQPDAWTTFNTQSMLGGALLGQKKYAEAEPLLVKGYEGLKAREETIPPEGSIRFPEALERLIELYTNWHASEPDKDYDTKAAEWQAKQNDFKDAANAKPSLPTGIAK